MQKKALYPALIIFSGACVFFACKKDSTNNNTSGKTKTQLITSSTWRFDNAKLAGVDVSGAFDDCEKDNTVTFVSNGTGTVDEGATKCDAADPQTVPFDWTFENNESSIHTTTPLFPGTSDFKINSLSETQLAVAKDTVILGTTQTFVVTFKH
ncbi:MAG: lipocalin family protein [Chitinophagaceae bacterium]